MSRIWRRELVPAALLILAFIAGVIESPHFLDVRYLLDSSSLYAESGLLALGMTLVIVCGHIDLSVASMMALVACITAKLLAGGCPVAIAAIAGLALGACLGAFNGVCVAYLRLPSFVVTLGTLAAYRGGAQAMLGASSISLPPKLVGADMTNLPGTPLPVPLCVFLLLALVIGVVLHQTVFGRWVFSVGTNARACVFAGVPTSRVVLSVFTLSGLMAALGGFLIDSRLGVARYDHARGLEVDVITAVVLGGASISGGVGSIVGTVLAVMLLAVLRVGMGLANITAEYQMAVVGTLLVSSVLLGNLANRTLQNRTLQNRRQISPDPRIAQRPPR